MNIKGIELFHIAIPCKPFETSFGTIDLRPALIIKMTGDSGSVGYGEASPLYTPLSEPETVEDGLRMLKAVLPSLIDREVREDFDVREIPEASQYPVSRIGIEASYLDLLAQSRNVPISTLFGATQTSVAAGESVGLKSSFDEVIRAVRGYVETGISRVKIKIAPQSNLDIIRAVRAEFPSLYLGVDANAAYTSRDIDYLSTLSEYNLQFVEQPFGEDDYKSHCLLRAKGVPICLDETVKDLATCKRAIDEGACDMINLKPARVGSFKESRAIHDHCVTEGIKLFGGGRLETGIGKTMNAAFYALPGFTEPSDITPPQDYLESDIVQPPFTINAGTYRLSEAAGIGVSIANELMNKYLIEKHAFGSL